MLKPLAATLVLLARNSHAVPPLKSDVAISTKTATPNPISWHVNAPGEKPTVGLAAGIKDGKPFEMTLWSAGGAVAGSLAGPPGTIIGAGVGALCGLAYSVFFVNSPHGPDQALRSQARPRD